MLKFLKNLFKEEEKPEENVNLNEISGWLDVKAKPFTEGLKNEIKNIIDSIDNEKEKVKESTTKLEDAKLQNPNIPNRAITIMEGNRSAFIKKVIHLVDNIDLGYSNYDELIKKSKTVEDDIVSIGKSTARSYQIMKEFFAREVENVAINIKNIENYSKEIQSNIKDSKIWSIYKLKDSVINLQHKIRSKERISNEIGSERKILESIKNSFSEKEKKIQTHKESKGFDEYKNMTIEKEILVRGIKDIEDKLFHDFSVLGKALKKYAKIAYENEKLIESYLKNSLKALASDENLDILKILNKLEKAIEEDKLGMDEKKNDRSLSKIRELNNAYFVKLQDNYHDKNDKLGKMEIEILNNTSKKQLDSYKEELESLDMEIRNINNKISMFTHELDKINIDNLKENLREEIDSKLNEKIVFG